MPVTEIISRNACRIECWAITESVAELERLCAESGITPVNNFVLEARYQQYMVTQLLFCRLFENETLKYKPSGKPYVSESRFISISHSGDVVVMMRSESECGVDIERIHPRVEKVKHKFLSDEELERVKDEDFRTLVLYWTAKEAMFKVYGSEDVFMRSNIFVSDVTSLSAHAELRDGELVIERAVYYHLLDEMMIAWTEPYNEE